MFTKIKNFIINPLNMLAVGAVALGLAFVDVLTSPYDVTGFSELRLLGKVSCVIFMIVLATLFFFYFIIPIGKWLVNLVK